MRLRKRLALVALAATTLALTACTPEQIATLEKLYRVDFTPAEERELLAAPDGRVKTALGWLEADGTFSAYVAPAGSRCPQWFGTAMLAGWPEADWAKLDHVMWGESRCNPNVLNDNPRTGDYSVSLLQVNIKPGIGTRPFIGPLVDWDFDRLYDPYTNLWVGRRMYDLWKSNKWSKNCGWWGWSARDRSWCG